VVPRAGLRRLPADRGGILGCPRPEAESAWPGSASRKLLHASRLQRNRASYLERYGQAAYDMMLGDCLRHVYAMIGKLERRVYLLSFDGPDL
jgi:hypothetical protein